MALAAIAQIMKLDPHLAAMVDPDKLANFLAAAFFTGINLLTNATHIKAMEEINAVLQEGSQPVVEIPVKRAESLK